jgi:hypothetical protein
MEGTEPETPEILQPPTMGVEYDPIPDDQDTEDEEEPDKEPKLDGPRLRHLVAKFDPNWDYQAVCRKFFEKDMKYLATLEHLTTNAHVHMQGYSRLADTSFAKKITRLAATHWQCKMSKGKRPVKQMRRPADCVGFQYMMKELKPPLVNNGFTQEELEDMKRKTTLVVHGLKTVVKDYVSGAPDDFIKIALEKSKDKEQLIQVTTRWLFQQQEEGLIELPEYSAHHTRTSIIRGLLKHPKMPRNWKADLYSI